MANLNDENVISGLDKILFFAILSNRCPLNPAQNREEIPRS